MKPPQWLGAVILTSVLVIVIASGVSPSPDPLDPDVIQVHGHIGNLKVPLFNHPEFKRILLERYGLEYTVEGMATTECCAQKIHTISMMSTFS